MKKFFTILFIGVGFSQAQTTIILKPNGEDSKDTWTHSAPIYQSWNYGQEAKLLVGAWTYNGPEGVHRTMIDFDWSQIPAGAVITSANLKLYAYEVFNGDNQLHSTLSGPNNGRIDRITESWNAGLMTYLDQPPTTSVNGVAIPASTSTAQDYTINVTTLVNDMYATNQKYGFCIRLITESYYRRLSFCSSEHPNEAKHPELIVTYTSTTGIEEAKPNYFDVYPNPVRSQLSVKSSFNLNSKEYSITDLSGRIILTGNLDNHPIDVSMLEKSCYLMIIDGTPIKFMVE